MIQRIQSLFLFAALILIAICFFIPVANISVPGDRPDTNLIYSFNLSGLKSIDHNIVVVNDNPWTLIFVGLLICFLLLVTIFLYKNRILQMRICVYTIVLSFTLNGLLYWLLHQVQKARSAEILYHIGFIFPILAGLLSILAFLAIRKDDKMVKSYDRLR